MEAAGSAVIDPQETQGGLTLSESQVASVPLNGRSFTDLLAISSGVIPVSSAQPNAVVMSGVASTPPSGDLDMGALSVSGQRETANAFCVNGANVQEDVNMGVAIVPTLDSVAGLNVLTDNFDAKLGNQSGGQIQVTTRSGTDQTARQRVRLLPQHGAGCAQLFLIDAGRVSSESVWRDARRSGAAEGRVLLCRLPGDAADPGDRYRIDCRPDVGGTEWESERRGAGADGHGEWGCMGAAIGHAARKDGDGRRAI